jgi:hypothetical protein
MQTWLLSVCFAGALAGVGGVDNQALKVGTDENTPNELTLFAKRLAGRVLGSFIQEGMTEKQVRSLLCFLPSPNEGFEMLGGSSTLTLTYPYHGLQVTLKSDNLRDSLAVADVDLWPLGPNK